jgi:hypothetical protein
MMTGWFSFLSDITSLRLMHSAQDENFRFIFLIATLCSGTRQNEQEDAPGETAKSVEQTTADTTVCPHHLV